MRLKRAPASRLLAALLAVGCGADPAPPPLPPPPPSSAASAPPVAEAPSVEPVASVAPTANAATLAPPRPCPPRPVYTPVSYTQGRTEHRGKGFAVLMSAPRLATGDAELAPSLVAVQAALDDWLRRKESFVRAGCGGSCSLVSYCEVTRNDGEYLSFLCNADLWARGTYSEIQREGLNFRRVGKRFEPLRLAEIARDPAADLKRRLFSPRVDDDTLQSSYLVLRDDALEVSQNLYHTPSGTVTRQFVRYAEAAPHLVCDTALDLRVEPTEGAPAGPLVVATHVASGDSDTPARTFWYEAEAPGITFARFAARRPGQAAAARLLNEAVARHVASVRARVAPGQGSDERVLCHAFTSTPRLVSVLCFGEGESVNLPPSAITLRLGDPPARIGAAELLAHRPGAIKEIARRCFEPRVRRPEHGGEPELPALPRLSVADLEAFGLWQRGALFAIPFQLGGERRIDLCFVPSEVLGTSVELLSRSAGR